MVALLIPQSHGKSSISVAHLTNQLENSDMTIAVFNAKPYEHQYLTAYNTAAHKLVFIDESLSMDTIEKAKGARVVSVFVNDDCSAPIIQKLKSYGIKHIAMRAAGYDNVDLVAAAEAGITVARVPEYSPHAVAEHAVALMMALNRKLVQAEQQVKAYNFLLDNLIGFDMNGKKVGIVGCGKIGAIVAKIMSGFGCNVLVHDICVDNELVKKYGVTYCSLDTLYEEADIISIHVPLNDVTRHMINKKAIAKMKKGVMIINTGRGAVIHTQEVLEGLKNGQIGYLGLDVYEFEKPLFFKDHSADKPKDDLFDELLNFPNVLITGHQAFLTETALKNIAQTTMNSIDQWANGKASPTEIRTQ